RVRDLFFCFQAEDGIRDFHVTGVQTCALPISMDGFHVPWFNQQRKGLELLVEPGDVETVHGDETKIKQILINLLHNAVKYTPRGTVAVRVEREPEGGVRILVIDSGPGIPEEWRERIFEPFERLHLNEPGEQKGLGLGLAVVRTYARAHGGDVTVEDAPGGGSCFIVRLPERPDAAPAGALAGETAMAARAGGERR